MPLIGSVQVILFALTTVTLEAVISVWPNFVIFTAAPTPNPLPAIVVFKLVLLNPDPGVNEVIIGAEADSITVNPFVSVAL